MRPLRFPGTFRWLIVAVLAVVFGLPLLPLAAWFTVAMPPLQRYYLLAYVESAETGKTPGSTTPVQWLYKTASGREHALAMNSDVVSASGGKLPVRLSSPATNDGWTGIEMSAPVRVNSAQLTQFLEDNIYNGRGFWTLMVEPILFGLAFILFLVAIALHIRERLRSGSKHEQRHGRRTRGPELLSSWRWNWKTKPDGIRFQLRWQNFLLDWWGSQLPSWATPTFRMRRNLEASHVLLMGDSGSGKSSAIRQILRQIAERGETAIVYDPALEFTPEFYSPKRGDMILNPLDTRCPYWDIADEVSTAEVATAMAAALFPEKDHEKEFFTDAPQRIFARLMCRRPTPQKLVQWMSDPAEIARMVQGTPYAAFLDSSAPAQSAGIISSFNMIADSFELLPSEDDTRQRFSTSRWEFERNKWVFLTSRPAFREKLLPLHSVWLDMLILRMMAPCVNPAKPVWFVLDELASLNKLPQLHTVVTESRKSGNPVVLGFQGRSQLEKRYGKDAEVILSQPATKIFLKTSEPHSAKWVSDAIGEVELERLKESRTAGLIGGRKQYTLEITTQPLVMASEISGLEPLHGYIKQENYVVRVRFPYVAPIEKQPREDSWIGWSAGAGKTTTLAVVREGAEAQGYTVEGFAPTSRAAHKLAEAGIETSTLQHHLARGEQPDTGERRLYVLDESSLASTRQMHEFVQRLHPNDRVLLVGDTRQHEAVEAGRPFAQLQEAGMRTVKLDEIVRQRDPELKQAVEQLAHGQVGAAVESLDRQGRVHEVKGHEERISAIAREYAKSPESTLVVSPDNRSRTEINQRIHDELQSRGVMSRDEHSINTIVPRQEMTGADRGWAQQYQVNDILRYSRSSQETGIQKGEYSRVVAVNAQENTLTVLRTNGEQTTYDPRRQMGVSVYREQEKAFSVGDRIQFTAPNQELKIANRELGTVEGIAQDGTMRLKLDNERSMSFDPQRHPHLDHGYAVTSYSSQGQTADRVLINLNTELGAKDLLNNRMAYVSVSRGAHDAQIFTNDREKLPQALGHDVSHQSAHTPELKPPQPEIGQTPKQEQSHGMDMGLSL